MIHQAGYLICLTAPLKRREASYSFDLRAVFTSGSHGYYWAIMGLRRFGRSTIRGKTTYRVTASDRIGPAPEFKGAAVQEPHCVGEDLPIGGDADSVRPSERIPIGWSRNFSPLMPAKAGIQFS